MHGRLSDPYDEFFIYANNIISQEISPSSSATNYTNTSSRNILSMLASNGSREGPLDPTEEFLSSSSVYNMDPVAAGSYMKI